MSFGDPSANAKRFVLDGNNQQYDAFIDMLQFEDFFTLNCRYKLKSDSKWTFLLAPEYNETKLSTSVDINSEIDRILIIINAKIAEVFGTGQTIPVNGKDRVKWIIAFALIESNNVVTRDVNLTKPE